LIFLFLKQIQIDMALLKKYYSANSLLESVMALAIISTCLYIAIMVYANVFTKKTAIIAYSNQNKMNEMFYLLQVSEDSLQQVNNENINSEWINTNLQEITIKSTDSLDLGINKHFYINKSE
jgi:hypothetical protein